MWLKNGMTHQTVRVIVQASLYLWECANCCITNINLEVSCVLIKGFIPGRGGGVLTKI